jgi:hypothetical protein
MFKWVWWELLFGEIESGDVDKNSFTIYSTFFKASEGELKKNFKNPFIIVPGCNGLYIDFNK